MTGWNTDPYSAHCQQVEALTAAGVEPPADWTALRKRYNDFQTGVQVSPQTELLAAAVVSGTPGDLTALTAQALAEAASTPVTKATVTNTVKHRVLTELQAIYAAVALENYRSVAQQFNKTASEFLTYINAVDVEANAADLITANDKTRAAWVSAEVTAKQLDRLAPVLMAAARLAGTNVDGPEGLLALTVDPEGLHRRRMWEAWESNGRCGRWSTIVALGAPIRAHDLNEFMSYRKPAPMQEKWISVERGISQRIVIDPEDPVTEPEPTPKKGGPSLRMLNN